MYASTISGNCDVRTLCVSGQLDGHLTSTGVTVSSVLVSWRDMFATDMSSFPDVPLLTQQNRLIIIYCYY